MHSNMGETTGSLDTHDKNLPDSLLLSFSGHYPVPRSLSNDQLGSTGSRFARESARAAYGKKIAAVAHFSGHSGLVSDHAVLKSIKYEDEHSRRRH
ncbi:hypothetical protein Bhyg_15024 [Pseudolycoriella hygida]|uniref:Uncharacterized protein n=1 Tax=Pseudolycoriella hygida TaxID=35572 RepID=A0A9Q0MSR6_9DIPT|nr:hypothetical protein Bhyg_15024 [Pseudolycoriella hygida]